MANNVNRRSLIKGIVASPFILSSTKLFAGAPAEESKLQPVAITVNSASRLKNIGSSITGLSYELAEIQDPDFFSASNRSLINLLSRLGRGGVLRIGGNTSDNAIYDEYKGPIPATTIKIVVSPKSNFHFSKQALQNLKGFVDAIGWKLVFGINMKINCPEMGAVLARDLQEIFSDTLLALHIGNEPNNYRYITKDVNFTFDEWYQLQRKYVEEIEKVVTVPIAAPDTGANSDWLTRYYDRQKDTPSLAATIIKGVNIKPLWRSYWSPMGHFSIASSE